MPAFLASNGRSLVMTVTDDNTILSRDHFVKPNNICAYTKPISTRGFPERETPQGYKRRGKP
jgi:hypothetical protein